MNTKVKINFTDSNAKMPYYATEGSAGLDLSANFKEPKLINPGERMLVPTGIKLELPLGFEAQVRPRSGLALKKGITVLNSPGTIDSDYRGEVGVILYNSSKEPFSVVPGDRIAQLVIAKYERVDFVFDVTMSETERGDGGFGSTLMQ